MFIRTTFTLHLSFYSTNRDKQLVYIHFFRRDNIYFFKLKSLNLINSITISIITIYCLSRFSFNSASTVLFYNEEVFIFTYITQSNRLFVFIIWLVYNMFSFIIIIKLKTLLVWNTNVYYTRVVNVASKVWRRVNKV